MSDEALDMYGVMDPLVISDDHGNVIFRLCGDGTVIVSDPRKMRQAAAIFWREVITMARRLQIPIAIAEEEK